MNLYQAYDVLCDKVDTLNQGSIDVVALKAKELNKDLETLIGKFKILRDIDYDPIKIDYLHSLTEKSMEHQKHLELIIERLLAVETIH